MYPCVVCKGRNCKKYFGVDFCPLKAKLRLQSSAELPKRDFTAPIRTPFIGHHKYPNVNAGVVHNVGASEGYDRDTIAKVVEDRMKTISIRDLTQIRSLNTHLQSVALAAKPAMMDVHLKGSPNVNPRFEQGVPPFGGTAPLKGLDEAEHVRFDPVAGKVHSDTDLKATDAISELAKRFDVDRISQILSTGAIGTGSKRKQVPTRWSITATDDTISSGQTKEIRRLPITDRFLLYRGSHFGNYFYILVFKGPFQYELFENHTPSGSVSHDFELPRGRKDYADETAGGYYAARIAITEKLEQDGIQGSALAIRIITEEYSVPLGVWVVRKAAREAMASQPDVFESADILKRYAIAHANKYHGADLTPFIRDAKILEFLDKQRSLADF